MQKISPFLWFDNQAEEAANFYVSIFKDAAIDHISRYPEDSPVNSGQVMVVSFTLFGQNYLAMNGGPNHKFTDAISFMVHCETQDEVDHYWDRLVEGGEPIQCGWLTDRYGLSWQITPNALVEMISDPDRERAGRAMQAMMGMVKINIEEIRRAYNGD